METPIHSLYVNLETLNVGIGTKLPQERLTVAGNICPSSNELYDLGTPDLRFKDIYLSGNSIYLGDTIISRNPSTGGVNIIDPYLPDTYLDMTVHTLTASNVNVLGDYVTLNTVTSNSERMVITNEGDGPALQVMQTGTQSIAEFYDDQEIALSIADGGNIGVGTHLPTARLHLHTSNQDTVIRFTTNNAVSNGFEISTNYSNQNIHLNQTEGSDIQVSTSNLERLRIIANGNVGIGTTRPKSKIHIDGPIMYRTYAINILRDDTETYTNNTITNMYIPYGVEIYDDYSLWNTTAYTVPVDGYYGVAGNAMFIHTGYNIIRVRRLVSGAVQYNSGNYLQSGTGGYTNITYNDVMKAYAGNTIQIYVENTNGNGVYLYGTHGGLRIWLISAF